MVVFVRGIHAEFQLKFQHRFPPKTGFLHRFQELMKGEARYVGWVEAAIFSTFSKPMFKGNIQDTWHWNRCKNIFIAKWHKFDSCMKSRTFRVLSHYPEVNLCSQTRCLSTNSLLKHTKTMTGKLDDWGVPTLGTPPKNHLNSMNSPCRFRPKDPGHSRHLPCICRWRSSCTRTASPLETWTSPGTPGGRLPTLCMWRWSSTSPGVRHRRVMFEGGSRVAKAILRH